jgi:predicted nucleic acid-binding protein
MLYSKAVLLDTGALFALADSRDGRHDEAVDCLNCLQRDSCSLFISNVTIYEAYRLILHELGIARALGFLENIFDGSVKIEYITQFDEDNARNYLEKYNDQPFTFVDALNFVVMKKIKIFKVFTFDRHFNIIGFVNLPPYYSE